jgi:integrase
MPSFRNAKAQAVHAVKQKLGLGQARHSNRHDQKIHSLGTKRNYEQALMRLTEWIQKNRLGDLKSLSPKTALVYLEMRGQEVGQKALDQERQAIQVLLQTKLPVIKSELSQALKSRAYTAVQIQRIAEAQTEKNRLATQIAYVAGLRAHELLTLLPKEARTASTHREWSTDRFVGREGEIYTVVGKGGLVREVLIPTPLAAQLETKRLKTPVIVKDRDIQFACHYDISGGKNWSNSFTAASQRALGWSLGAHGVRHSFAQNRMDELQQRGFFYAAALEIVSQTLGHFRADITEVYLR